MVRLQEQGVKPVHTVHPDIPIENLLRVVCQRVVEGEQLSQDARRGLAFLVASGLAADVPPPSSTSGRDAAEQYRLEYRQKAASDAASTEAARRPADPVSEGYYRLGDQFVKVQTSLSTGNRYAKVWDPANESWEYAKGVMRRLRPEMALTAEQAKQFGALYGRCVFCCTRLTDERSIEAGYGPTCADNHNLPWG